MRKLLAVLTVLGAGTVLAQGMANPTSPYSIVLNAPATAPALTLNSQARICLNGATCSTYITGDNDGVGLSVSDPGQAFHMYNGNFLFDGTSETSMLFKRTGTIGLRDHPIFALGRIVAGGVDEPEIRFVYDDASAGAERATERTIAALESTGTLATVSDATPRSHFEGFIAEGAVDPRFRISAYPSMQFEAAANGCRVAIGGAVRAANVVTVTCSDLDSSPQNHGFAVGDEITLNINGTDTGWADVPSPGVTVATVPSASTFTYAEVASNDTNTVAFFYTDQTDVALRRSGDDELSILVGDGIASDETQSTKVMVNAAGVTIGSTTPVYPLHITGVASEPEDAVVYIAPTTMADAADAALKIEGPTGTGLSQYAVFASMNTSAQAFFGLENLNAGASAHGEFQLAATGGDPKITFTELGVRAWALGVDNSANAFRISVSDELSTSTFFEASSAGAVLINNSLQVGSATHAGVVTGILSNTATLDFPDAVTATCDDLTITVTGAATTSTPTCSVGFGITPPSESSFTCWVSASNTVTVRHCADAVSANPDSGTFRVTVHQY